MCSIARVVVWKQNKCKTLSLYTSFQVDVVELHLTMTPSMIACQHALLDLIQACIKELKQCNSSVSHNCVLISVQVLPSCFQDCHRPVLMLLQNVLNKLVHDSIWLFSPSSFDSFRKDKCSRFQAPPLDLSMLGIWAGHSEWSSTSCPVDQNVSFAQISLKLIQDVSPYDG